jgi:hypothetical protein
MLNPGVHSAVITAKRFGWGTLAIIIATAGILFF